MTETKITSLTEGNHDIQISLAGYDTLDAVINVTADNVLCVGLGIDGTLPGCGSSVGPGVVVSGWTVRAYLKESTGVSARCTWIATQDLTKVAFITAMVLAYAHVPPGIGFVPSAYEIGQAVLMYKLPAQYNPSNTWGC